MTTRGSDQLPGREVDPVTTADTSKHGEESNLTRRETLRRAGRMAYVAPTIMVFSMSAFQERGPGSPPPPPGKEPPKDPQP